MISVINMNGPTKRTGDPRPPPQMFCHNDFV